MFAALLDCSTPKLQLKKGVQGNIVEKILFYALLLIAAAFFAISAISAMKAAATDTMTSVTFTTHEMFEFPAMFFCNPADSPVYTPIDGTSNSSTYVFAGTDFSCPNGEEALKVVTDFDGKFQSRKCIGKNATSPMVQKVEDRLLQMSQGQKNFSCVVFDQNITANRSDANTIFLTEGRKAYSPRALSYNVAGFYDPQADVNESLATMRFYWLNGFNNIAEVGLEYDTELDLSKTFQFTESTGGDRKKLYSANVNQAPIQMSINASSGVEQTPGIAIIRFSVGSYLGRDIILRKKSFTEIWGEIGGCWASALLLVSIFYVRRSTTRQDGSSVETQVLRFRGEHSKLQMLKELRAYLEDQSEAVEDVTGESLPDPETGVPANGPTVLTSQADTKGMTSQTESSV